MQTSKLMCSCSSACRIGRLLKLQLPIASGTGEIARLVGSAAFQPQAAAFTSMLSMCAKVCFFSFHNKLHAHSCGIQAPGRAHLPLFTSLAILALAKGERLSLLGVDLSATTVPGSSL